MNALIRHRDTVLGTDRLHQVLDIALPPRILALDPEQAATR
jgi:hypothetical protein